LGTFGIFFGNTNFLRKIRHRAISHQDGIDAVRFKKLPNCEHFHLFGAAASQPEDSDQTWFVRGIVFRFHSLSILRRIEVWLETMEKVWFGS
jgi:hypothetical protein